jgi:nicotinic acid phosphoribosyltransferase
MTSSNIYENKTKRLLLPCTTRHGLEFITKLNPISKFIIKYGIHDMCLRNLHTDEKKICILLRTENHVSILNFLEFIRDQDYFIKDYPLSHDTGIIMFNVPEKYYQAYDRFIAGDYEEMYSLKDIDSLRFKEEDRNILKGNDNAKRHFISKLYKEFGVRMNSFEVSHPFELPLKFQEEFLNIQGSPFEFITPENYHDL